MFTGHFPRKIAKPLVCVVNNYCCIPKLQSWRLPEVIYEDARSVVSICELFHPNKFTAYISAELSLCGILRDGIGLAGEEQRPDNQARSGEAKQGAKPRREYLVFGGIRGSYLGIQIASIVLLDFGLSALTGVSFFRAIDNGDRMRRWLPVAGQSGLCGLFFWGWAWARNPLSA